MARGLRSLIQRNRSRNCEDGSQPYSDNPVSFRVLSSASNRIYPKVAKTINQMFKGSSCPGSVAWLGERSRAWVFPIQVFAPLTESLITRWLSISKQHIQWRGRDLCFHGSLSVREASQLPSLLDLLGQRQATCSSPHCKKLKCFILAGILHQQGRVCRKRLNHWVISHITYRRFMRWKKEAECTAWYVDTRGLTWRTFGLSKNTRFFSYQAAFEPGQDSSREEVCQRQMTIRIWVWQRVIDNTKKNSGWTN